MDLSAEKFLFGTRFDDPVLEDDGVDSEETAREKARTALVEEGRQAGLAEARQETGQHAADALARLPDALTAIASAREVVCEEIAGQAAEVAVAIVRKSLPALAKREAVDEIMALIRDSVRDLMEEPRIVVRVNDALLDAIREQAEPALAEAGFAGDVVLLAEPGFAAGDCRVEWAEGGAERDSRRIWSEINNAVKRVTGAALADPQQPAQQEPAPYNPDAETEIDTETTPEAAIAPVEAEFKETA